MPAIISHNIGEINFSHLFKKKRLTIQPFPKHSLAVLGNISLVYNKSYSVVLLWDKNQYLVVTAKNSISRAAFSLST